jgi:hypothetical protein
MREASPSYVQTDPRILLRSVLAPTALGLRGAQVSLSRHVCAFKNATVLKHYLKTHSRMYTVLKRTVKIIMPVECCLESWDALKHLMAGSCTEAF